MSETETEREVEIVTGTIKGVIVKGVDKWQVEVQPDGSEYTKKLWTKDAELVAWVPEKIGQHGGFVCNASYWTNNEGKQVRSLWIQSAGPDGEAVSNVALTSPDRVATPAAAPQAAASRGGDGMSKEEWARKDSAIHKMACIKTAADALKHTLPSEPSTDDLNRYLTHVAHLALAWHRSVLAERDDPAGESVPF